MENEVQVEGGVSGYMESLRRERDRFVALAFCAADLLLEVDSNSKITYAAGATQSLVGHSPEDLTGTSFTDLIAPDYRDLMAELIRGMTPGSRLDPVRIRLNGEDGATPALSVTGYHLPDLPGCLFFALRLGAAPVNPDVMRDLRRDPGSGLLEKESFAELATERMQEAARRGENLKLTMLRTPKFTEFRSRLDRETSESLTRTLGACLQASSVAGGTAGRLDDENYGLVHKPGLDVGDVQNRFSDLIKSADPRGVGIPVSAATIEAAAEGMSDEDSLRVLLYTVNRFCESDGDISDMTGLSENLAEMSRDTSRKMSYFRKISKSGDFEIAFQPIVSVDSEEIHHFEALARFGGDVDKSPYKL
ncbi:MAG: PAS domain S-box protein, partial [Alphaproteobacteria bacterium]